jgi:hypothetical protein
MARNTSKRTLRDTAIREYYSKLYATNKLDRKYRNDYLIRLTADKFYLQERTIYNIIRNEPPKVNANQLNLFSATGEPSPQA